MHAHQASPFIESKNISDLKKYRKPKSVVVVDLDNTIQEASLELGSDQWFRALCEYGATIKLEGGNAISLVIAIYHAVQIHVNTKPVEDAAVTVIRELQEEGTLVLGLTSRDTKLTDATYRQLEAIGVNLRGNIIFCCGEDKGVCLLKEFDARNLQPPHVVMAEDLVKHLHRVKAALDTRGIDFTGLRYGFLDEKVKALEMERAHAQLLQLKPYLHTSTQLMIDRLGVRVAAPDAHPNYLDHFYLPQAQHQAPRMTRSMPVLERRHSEGESEFKRIRK